MAYDVSFEIAPTIGLCEHEAIEGTDVHVSGSYSGTGTRIDSGLPKFRAWLDYTGRRCTVVEGDHCPAPLRSENGNPSRPNDR